MTVKEDDNSRNKEVQKKHQLKVSNLPPYVVWQTLKDVFKEFGTVLRADIEMDRNGFSSGIGTVLYEEGFEANVAAQNMNGAFINDREIKVEFDDIY